MATADPSPSGVAHPRSRGENLVDALATAGVEGSSPLTRGKPFDKGSIYNLERLIPAHAGKTLLAVTPSIEAEAHPRSRGENSPRARQVCAGQGSSPLTRGKLEHAEARRRPERLIPAHAGKTSGQR